MSFSKNLSTYDPEWQAILEQFGGPETYRDVVLVGPFDKGVAAHQRAKFYAYRALVQASIHMPQAAYDGSYRVVVRLLEQPDGWYMEIADRNRNAPKIIGLKKEVRTIQNVEVQASLDELHQRMAEEETTAKAIAGTDKPRKYY